MPRLPAAGLGNQPLLPRGTCAPPAAAGPGPAGASARGQAGRGERAVRVATAGPTGVCRAVGARKAATAAPQIGAAAAPQIGAAAADSASALTRQRRSARATTCTQSEPAALGGDRRPPPPGGAALGLRELFGSTDSAKGWATSSRPHAISAPPPPSQSPPGRQW